MKFFDLDYIFFEALGYSMSYIEFFATLTGAFAVWLAAKGYTINWPVGLVNVMLSFFLFYQVQLYPDMLLQIFFFITGLLGWYRWTHPKPEEADTKKELRVTFMSWKQLLIVGVTGILGTVMMGSLAENLHTLLPVFFPLPSAFPYADSFVTVMSIITTFLVINKKVESWIIWIFVDALAAYLYFLKDIKFISLEYVAFCFIAAFGLINWLRQHRSYQPV